MQGIIDAFNTVAQHYGEASKIPHHKLYGFLIKVKPDLMNWAKLVKVSEETGQEVWQGCKEIEASPLGVEVRRRCQVDLFWLSRYFLWESNPEGAGKDMFCPKCRDIEHPYRDCTHRNKVTLRTHGPICNLFVAKNPSLHIGDQDEVCKQRMLLYPRGSFKSTIDVADVVQWIVCFPEIRILFLTAGQRLAVGFLDETKGHFVERLYEKSLMNLFFHDFCLPEKEIAKMNMYEFDCPVWTRKGIMRREHTVMASSIESKLSGFHFEIIKADDTVEVENSQTEEQCAKIIKNFYLNIKMLMPYGYLDLIGTRYHDLDLYGEYLEKNAPLGNPEVSRKEYNEKCWTGIENKNTGFKALIGTGWTMKPEWAEQVEKGLVRDGDVPEGGYNIMFPENLPFKKLRQEQAKNEASFESQIQQNPRSEKIAVFTRPMLLANTVPADQLPFNGPKVITWDFAFSRKKGRDYCTAVVGQYNHKGQLFIVDLVRRRFKPLELAQTFVQLARAHRPIHIAVENAAGSRLIEPTIIYEAQKTGDLHLVALLGRIDWFPPDNQKDAKYIRMAALAPLFINKMLFLSAALPQLDIVYNEFERCLTSHHHEDVPDVISFQMKYVPRMNVLLTKKEYQTFNKTEAAWNMMFEEDYRGEPGRGFVFDPETNSWLDTAAPVNPISPVIDTGLKAETPDPAFDPILGGGIIG